jgi:pimeloyl-ACP methyl ester carboxylesterase
MTSWKLASSLLLLGGIAFAGLTWGRALMRERAAEAAYPAGGMMVEVEGAQMHLEILGESGADGAPAKPDIVLIHGASGSLRDMTFRLAPMLAEHYRVFAVDRPGFGYSDALSNDTIHAQAERIRAAVTVAGARDPIVLGHSYGGAVALAWAIDHPETLRALVLAAAPSHLWPGPPPTLYRWIAPPLGQRLLVPLITAWVPTSYVEEQVAEAFTPQSPPEGYSAHFGPEMTLRLETMRVNALQRVDLKPQIGAMIASYPELDMPIEMVHGDADKIVDLTLHSVAMTKANPRAKLQVLAGQGHMIQQTATEALVAAVDRAAIRSAR